MCGILGFLQTAGGRSGDEGASWRAGQAMAHALAHRGPDDEGLWQDANNGILLGHRRLSIIDLSPDGHQPMVSRSGRYILTFNGEIYNFRTLQKDLQAAGVTFKGRSDTEVLLAACEEWGINRALQRIDGMFAFALWDNRARCLHLARDRLGKKPLYVGWSGQTLLFASELKAIRAYPGFRPAVNRDVLALYMRFGSVPAPHCIYESVWQLLPGGRLTISEAGPMPSDDLSAQMETYWHHGRVVEAARHAALPLSDAEAVDRFEALLQECVQERMISDVPLGALLSGGLDSSAVVALMQRQSVRPIRTFTIGFHEAGFDEAASARAVAQHLGTEHHELYVTPEDALAVIPRLPDIYDEPFSDESQIPVVLLSAFARTQVTVALTGDGGDEMLGGYARHVQGAELWQRFGWLPLPLRRFASRQIHRRPPSAWDKLSPRHPRFGERLYKAADMLATQDPGDVYLRLVSRWEDTETLVPGSHTVPIPLLDSRWQPPGLSFAERMMFDDALTYLPNDVLVKVDRASMAAGLECRSPLLDRRIFEFAWRCDQRLKIRDGKGKWLLRRVLARHLPAAIFERPKQGFSVPIAAWLQGPLRDWAHDLLDEKRVREQGFLDPARVSATVRAFDGGATELAYPLWTLLMFQSWRDRWMS